MNDHPQRIVISGAAGHLGSHLAPLLAQHGYAVLGFDVTEPARAPQKWQFRKADLLVEAELEAVLQDADLLIHAASIHPWKPYTDAQYLDINIKGTWLLYAAAVKAGIERVVLTSSIAANAMGGVPMGDWPVTETAHYTPMDMYSYTKFCQEEAARLHARAHGVRTIALRPPAFMPADDLQTIFRLTGCFALVEDIAQAHLAAVELFTGRREAAEPLAPFEAFYVTNDLPYVAADVSLLNGVANPRPLVAKYWPQALPWLTRHGYEGGWLPAFYDNSKAKRLLAWEPQHCFTTCWQEVRRRYS